MALLTTEIALVDNNQSAGREAFFRWKEALVAAGWTVEASGDGDAIFSTVGDVITGFNLGANGVNNRAWVRIQRPDGIEELTAQLITGEQGIEAIDYRVKRSPVAKFTGGAPSAIVTPSATDETIVTGAGTDAAPNGVNGNMWAAENPTELDARSPHFIGMAETTFPYRFWYSHHVYGPLAAAIGFQSLGGWLRDIVIGQQSPTLPDNDPVYMSCNGESSPSTAFSSRDGGNMNDNSDVDIAGVGRMATSGAGQKMRAAGPTNQGQTNDTPWLAGAYDMVPAVVYRRDTDGGTTGIKGVLSWLRGTMPLFDGVTTISGIGITLDGVDYSYLVMNTTAMPWNGVAPASGSWSRTVDGILWNQLADRAFAGADGVQVYRMRAFDTTLARTVYWNAPKVDAAGDFYTGPGPLISVLPSNFYSLPMV